MAKQPHHDDDQSKKKPNGDAAKTLKPKPVPNMSLDEPEPAEEVLEVEEVLEDAVPVAEPAEEIAEAEPYVLGEDAVIPDEVEEAEAIEEPEVVEAVEEAEEVAEAEPVVEAAFVDEPVAGAPMAAPVHDAPEDDLLAAMEEPESAPPSFVDLAAASAPIETPAEEITSAEPWEDEAAAEIAEAAPASDVIAAHEHVEQSHETIAQAHEAAPGSDVFADEPITEGVPASAIESGEVVEEAAEVVDEPSSATRRTEVVLGGEGAEAESTSPSSAVELAGDVADAEPISATSAVEEAEEVIDEAEAVEAGSSGVISDIAVAEDSGAKPASGQTTEFGQTMAYQPPSSKRKTEMDDALVTEEEVVGSAEASAVDLGDMPARKGGSSVTGIDKVAEALESGLDVGGSALDIGGEDAGDAEKMASTVPSVEFDELLDEAEEVKPARKKTSGLKTNDAFDIDEEAETIHAEAEEVEAAEAVDAEEATDEALAADAEEAEEAEAAEAFEEEVEAAEAGEAVEAAEGEEAEAAEAAEEDVDLDALFSDGEGGKAESAEAVQGEEAEAAEAAEGEEAEAADEDGAPKKKSKFGKGAHAKDEADEDDEPKSKKKKGTKEKAEVATTTAPAGGYGCITVIIGMFLVIMVLSAGVGAFGFFMPEQVIGFVHDVHPKLKPKPAEKHVPSALDNANAAMGEGKFQEAADLLKDADKPAEFGTRGEARWFTYLKGLDKDAAPEADNQAVKDAMADLEKSENKLLLAQIKATFALKGLREEADKANAAKLDADKALATANADKTIAEKKIDAARQVLVKGNYIKKEDDLNAVALEKLLKDLSSDKVALDAVNTILTDAKFKEGVDGLKEVLAKKKEADDAVNAINKVLADDAKIKDTGAKGVLDVIKARDAFKKNADEFLKTISDAFTELTDGKASKMPEKELVAAAKRARLKGESPLSIPLSQLGMSLGSIGTGAGAVIEQGFNIAKLQSQVKWFQGREPFIQTPEQKMDIYLAMLQDRKNKDAAELKKINLEADWVRSPDSKADKDSRTKARLVLGLAMRNEEKFAEAKAAFAETLTMIPKVTKSGTWQAIAQQSHRELVNPNEYYIPRMTRFQAEGNSGAALAEANLALKAIPDNGLLHAHRGLIRFEMIQGKGAKTPAPAQKAIRDDAEAAAKDKKLAAEAAYIVGLLEEELGNMGEAEKLYRDAIKLHPAQDDAGGKYRVALARLLLRDRPDAGAPAAPPADEKKKDDKVGVVSPVRETTIVMHPWTPLLVSAAIGQAQPFDEIEDKEAIARLTETIKLAEELIASKNEKIKGQGFLLKGSALSKLGKRTEGLKEYSKGLKLIYPGIETKEMNELIEDHPAFQRPDADGSPNPIMAEKHFGEGIHHYWAKQYPQAEAQFNQAIRFYNKDARYWYYLGLAQVQQKTKTKRDHAFDAFDEGARLEVKMASSNPDTVREINASLERIQGELRQYLNSRRYKVKAEEQESK